MDDSLESTYPHAVNRPCVNSCYSSSCSSRSHRWPIAGKYNKTLSVGDAAPEWKDLEGTDGQKHSLADFKDKEVVVLAFTCNSCPYATDHEERIGALHKRFAEDGKGVVIAINPNQVTADLLPAMKTRAESRGLKYLLPARPDAASGQELRRNLHAGIRRAQQGPQSRLSRGDGRQPGAEKAGDQEVCRGRCRRRAGRQGPRGDRNAQRRLPGPLCQGAAEAGLTPFRLLVGCPATFGLWTKPLPNRLLRFPRRPPAIRSPPRSPATVTRSPPSKSSGSTAIAGCSGTGTRSSI